MRLDRLTGTAAVAFFATAMDVSAAPVITPVAPGSFSLLNLAAGTPNSRQPTTGPIIVNSGGITTILFSDGTATGDPTQASGVYAGNQASISASPLGPGDSTTNYLTAQPDPDLAHNVTVNYAAPKTILDILWGTVDGPAGYNLITTSAGEMIIGAQVLAALGNPLSGSTNTWLEITGLTPFTWIAVTDSSSNPSAFEFLPAVTVNVPEPASLTLIGSALFGFGLLRRQRRAAFARLPNS
jgi:hypothetical protein